MKGHPSALRAAVLTLLLLHTAKVARLEKRAGEGLLPDTGPAVTEDTLEPTGGLQDPGDDERAAGVEARVLRLLWFPRPQGWMWSCAWLWV